MKTLTTNLMIAAAALTALAAGASAQSLTAEIPFAFRAGGTALQPGAYRVTMTTSVGRQLVTIRGVETSGTVILANYIVGDASAQQMADGRPKLGFECAAKTCVLRDLWRGGDTVAYRFFGPKLRGDDVHLAEVALTPTKAD
jgi:hypothetical protein